MRVVKLMVLLVALVMAPPVSAPVWAGSDDVARIVFDEVTRRIVHEYYGVARQGRMSDADTPSASQSQGKKDKKNKGKNKGESMPPGLARRANLPPGLQRHLDKNGRLPPGLAKRDLPGDLHGQLPRLRSGLKRVIIDRDVLLIEAATGLVLDVIAGVVRSK